jgi:hypothetical protein
LYDEAAKRKGYGENPGPSLEPNFASPPSGMLRDRERRLAKQGGFAPDRTVWLY